MQGETIHRNILNELTNISIHSPYAGRDSVHDFSPFLFDISIHSPYAGRDWLLSSAHGSNVISIHSPYAGRDRR